TFTRVHVGASRWHLPFAIGYVDLPNGVRVFSHLRDSGKKLKVDGHVRAVTAEVGRDAEGHPLMAAVFEPAENA
ncbi:MAG: OB-fold domain-containing protein, partial [Pseudorhodoplanes sp.]